MRGSRKFCQRGTNSDKFFFSFLFLRGERLQKPPKAGNYRPASETPLKWHFAGEPIMAHIECWLGSFVFFTGSGPILQGNSLDL